MALQASPSEVVKAFLSTTKASSTKEEEAALTATLTELYYSTSKLRVLHDQRQVERLVEHVVSGVVRAEGPQARLGAQLLVVLLKSHVVKLSAYLYEAVPAWLSRCLQHHNQVGPPQLLCSVLAALAALLRLAPVHSDEVYHSLAGSRGSLTSLVERGWAGRPQAMALQCLHLLTYVGGEEVAGARQRGEELYPEEVVASIQRVTIAALQQPRPNTCSHRLYLGQTASALSILYNLVVCAPQQVLASSLLTACTPFAYYGLPGVSHDQLQQDLLTPQQELSLSSGVDSDTAVRNYTNRNRRKRLRRKRPQPSRFTGDCEVPQRLAALPGVGLPGAPPAAALANISLKPEWTRQTDCSLAAHPIQSADIRVTSGEDILKHKEEAQEDKLSGEEAPASRLSEEEAPASRLSGEEAFENRLSSSETDYSDLEGSGEKESTLTARVRLCALQAINALIDKAGKQQKFSFWAPLMCQSPSLMTGALRDPSLSARMAALQVISTFLLDSSQVLALAVDSEEGRSYTSMSQQLGRSLRELHRCLALALLSERFPAALVRILKTVELLVGNMNYTRLKPGLLTKVVTHVKCFLWSKEAVVRANAFSVMVSVLMVRPQVPELHQLLLRYQTPAPPTLAAPPHVQPPDTLEEELPDDPDLSVHLDQLNLASDDVEHEGGEAEASKEGKDKTETMVSWLVHRCLDSLLNPHQQSFTGIYIQVQLQSLKVLNVLVSEHLSLIHPSLTLIQRVIGAWSQAGRDLDPSTVPALVQPSGTVDPGLSSPDPGAVVEHAYTLLGALMGAVKVERERVAESCILPDQHQQLWLWALQGPLQVLFETKKIKEEEAAAGPTSSGAAGADKESWRRREVVAGAEEQLRVLVAAAGVFSHLNSAVFESVGEGWQGQVVGVVSWLVKAQDGDLQLAGLRTLAIMVTFPGVVGHTDGPGLLQASLVVLCELLARREANVNKDRLLASWALANLTSALPLYMEGWQGPAPATVAGLLCPDLLAGILQVGVRACQDKDKIKPHAVRCLGNVVSFLQTHQVQGPGLPELVGSAVGTLVTAASTGNNMKTRWNACHSLGNVLASAQPTPAPWTAGVLATLGRLVESFSNYKVRLQACTALCCLTSREQYGEEYLAAWRALLLGLDHAQNILDYQEIKHRDDLINQICQGLCQLMMVLTLRDAGTLCDLLQLHQDTAAPHMTRAASALTPDRAGWALKAHLHVEQLLASDVLTEAQQQALSILLTLTSFSPV